MTTLFVILTLIGFGLCLFLYYTNAEIKKKFTEYQIHQNIKEYSILSGIPLYYSNPVLGVEIITPSLRKLINIEDKGKFNLEQLRDYFRPENPGVLGGLIAELYNGKTDTVGSLKVPGTNRRVICQAKKIISDENQITAILLLFSERFSDHSNTNSEDIENSKDTIASLLTILNNSPYPTWQRNANREIVYANFAYLRILGNNFDENSSLEIYENGKTLAERAIESSSPQTERRHLVIRGQRNLFKITEIPIENNMTVGFARDISEQEEIEEELEQNIKTQSNFLETSTNGSAIFGPDKRLLFFNSSFVKLWSIDEKWLETRPEYGELLDLLREKRKLPEQADFRVFKEKQLNLFTQLVEPTEEFFYLPDGRVLRVIAIPHESGGLIFAYEDITSRLALEQSYNTLIAVKKATIDNLREGIAVIQEDGRLNLYNPNYSDIWQLDNEYLDSKPHISDLLEETKYLYNFDGDWEKYKRELIAVFSRRTSSKTRLIRKDGSVLDWSTVPLPDGNTLMTYSDITDSFLVEKSLRSEREALKEADNLKSNFLANVSYELRSPLTSIRGFSEALLSNYFGELTEKQKEYLSGIYKSSIGLSSLINDILDMASIDAGYMALDIEEFDIKEAINSIVPTLLERAKNSERKLEINCPDNIGKINADKKRILQITSNLVNNAIRQTTKNGKIELNISGQENSVTISVKDDGQAIDLKDHQDIFKHFYKKQFDNYDADSTALSLPIVKSFVELHGGKISVHSAAKEGTTITCIFNRKA